MDENEQMNEWIKEGHGILRKLQEASVQFTKSETRKIHLECDCRTS